MNSAAKFLCDAGNRPNLRKVRRKWVQDKSMLNEGNERREIKAVATTMLSDPLELLAEDFKEALLRHYSIGQRKAAVSISKTTSDCPLLPVLLEDGQRLHLTVTRARS
ncbi:hypothetical protein EAS62_37480 [Bradyrhizobium zhanjiangense]|uniref:Uncharacterized protein n=2 Tax=Bradyrhizobium zhanjiangense TaxID=1325107 RepID=A0ABY0DAC8_9BRAD|nr:hypothetical protein EAS62_37480 [Bradyrhizobium zhanjiangense]